MRLLLRSRLFIALVLAAAVLRPMPALTAADGVPTSDEELRRQAQEVERLQKELQRAQSELKKAEAENQRLRQEKTQPAPTAAPAKPVPAVATLPPLEPEQVLEVSDLVRQFTAEPEAAGQRYTKQMLRVKGAVAGFDPDLVTRGYAVRLESPDKSVTVVCHFKLPDHYTAVYTKRKGQELVGRVGERTEVPFSAIGDLVTIEGKCKGLKKGEISFSGCELMK
jgi:hypothetical protein